MTGDRAVHIGAGVSNSVIQTGDGNVAHLTVTHLPDSTSVDIHEALAELRAALAEMSVPEAGKVGRALDDADEETARDEPDKAEVAGILTRALNYARKAVDFSEHLEKIAPLVARIAGWVGAGAASAPLLAAVGLTAG